MIVCGRANFTNLSRYSNFNERTYRRNYANVADFDALNLWCISQATDSSIEQIAAVDCSFVPKSGKKTEGLDRFFNGSHSKCERGLEWSVLSIIDLKQNTAYPLNAQQTPAQLEIADETTSESATRVDWYLKQVQQVRNLLPPLVKYLAADGYYSKKKWIDGIVALELHAIGKLRRDSHLK